MSETIKFAPGGTARILKFARWLADNYPHLTDEERTTIICAEMYKEGRGRAELTVVK